MSHAHESDLPTIEAEIPEAIVSEIRVLYKSGSYIQLWFKRFEVTTDCDSHELAIKYELPDVHPSAAHQLTQPILLGAQDIESIWLIQTMCAQDFYQKSFTI